MSKTHVSLKELKNAFHGFKRHIDNTPSSRYTCLDMFYAVECGLKAVLLQKKNIAHTSNLPDTSLTHCLHGLAQECNLQHSHSLPSRVSLGTQNKNNSIACKNFHQALRYGAKMQDKDWQDFEEKLKRFYDVLKQKIEEKV